MNRLQTILVATDFSPASIRALEFADRLARTGEIKLIVLHVIPDESTQHLAAEPDDAPFRDLSDSVDTALDSLASTLDTNRSMLEVRKCFGHPFAELLETVRTESVDLLVMGANGAGSPNDTAPAGALAIKCVRKIPTKVLLVRNPIGELKSVTVLSDFSPTSTEALRQGFRLAWLAELELDIIHIVYPPERDYCGLVQISARSRESPSASVHRMVEEQFDRQIESIAPEEPVAEVTSSLHILESPHVASRILAYLGERGETIAVMGTRGRTGLDSLLIGSTAEKVALQTPSSLLAIKPQGFRYPR